MARSVPTTISALQYQGDYVGKTIVEEITQDTQDRSSLNNELATKEQLSPPKRYYQPHRKRLTMSIVAPWDIGCPPRCLPQYLQLPARLTPPVIARTLATTHKNFDQTRTYRLFNDARATPVLSNITKISNQYAALHNINIKGHYVLNCDSILRLQPRR